MRQQIFKQGKINILSKQHQEVRELNHSQLAHNKANG